MVLPSLIVGNELLILAGVASAVGLWFFAHRHGQLRGLVDAAEAAVVNRRGLNGWWFMSNDFMPMAMAAWAARNLPARLDVAETAKLSASPSMTCKF